MFEFSKHIEQALDGMVFLCHDSSLVESGILPGAFRISWGGFGPALLLLEQGATIRRNWVFENS